MKGQKPKWELEEAKAIALRVRERIAPACERVEVAGSIRRGKPQIGDIEFVVIPRFETKAVDDMFGTVQSPKRNVLWDLLDGLSDKKLVDYTKAGDRYRQFQFMDEPAIQIDLFTCSRDNWGWIYLVRTGSATFSHHIASRLNASGYTSTDGWICGGQGSMDRIETPREEDVFALARETYRPPGERNWE